MSPFARYCVLVVVGCVLASMSPSSLAASEAAAKPKSRFNSPYADAARSLEFFDAVVRRVEFAFNYSQCTADSDSDLGLRRAEARTCLERKRTKDGSPQTVRLIIALFPRLQGGYELFFAGDVPGTTEANPDLATVQAQIEVLTEDIRAVGDVTDDYLVYPLSYIQTDRAIATLKSLGYPVVEFDDQQKKTDPPDAARDVVFEPLTQTVTPPRRRPLIINMVDSKRTTLVPASGGGSTNETGGKVDDSGSETINLGGQQLDDVTAGVPQQRLMIVWDTRDPEDLHELLDHLRLRIDVPARQILIEAQVIELDVDYLRELGIEFGGSKDGNSWSFEKSTQGLDQPFTYTFNRPSIKSLLNLNVTLSALEDDGNARVLSRPSVLVLDGRQARIQVGSKIPFTSDVTVTGDIANFTNKYLNVGIALNLRPRANQDGSEVTMQVETLISSAGASQVAAETNTLIAPPILSREVQSLVRVANDTPFIIGGLISASRNENDAGIPGLRKIPWFGRLFSRQDVTRERTEVIVVITPHVIPVEDDSFSYTVPKDADLFDSFNTKFFRNTYRVRHKDLLDFAFITESNFYQEIIQAVLNDAQQLVSNIQDWQMPSPAQSLPSFSSLRNVNPDDSQAIARSLRETVSSQSYAMQDHPCETISCFEAFLKLQEGRISKEEFLAKQTLIWSTFSLFPFVPQENAGGFYQMMSGQSDSPDALLCQALPCSEAYLSFLEGRVPGEDILVKRMLLRLVQNLELASYVPLEKISYFIRNEIQDEADVDSKSEKPPESTPSISDDMQTESGETREQVDIASKLQTLLETGRPSEAGDSKQSPITDPILQLRTDLADRLNKLKPSCRGKRCRPDSICDTLALAYRNETLPGSGVPGAARSHINHLQESSTPDSEHLSFDPPRALVTQFQVENQKFLQRLRDLNASGGQNARRWKTSTLLLNSCFGASEKANKDAIERLRQVLVLERVLDLNPSLPLTLEGFHIGREIVFPTPEDLADVRYLIDRQTAELFYETVDYYYAFEQVFRDAVLTDDVQKALGF